MPMSAKLTNTKSPTLPLDKHYGYKRFTFHCENHYGRFVEQSNTQSAGTAPANILYDSIVLPVKSSLRQPLPLRSSLVF